MQTIEKHYKKKLNVKKQKQNKKEDDSFSWATLVQT
jgi:hypothetical protein